MYNLNPELKKFIPSHSQVWWNFREENSIWKVLKTFIFSAFSKRKHAIVPILSVRLSVSPFICPSVCPSVIKCLSVYLSIYSYFTLIYLRIISCFKIVLARMTGMNKRFEFCNKKMNKIQTWNDRWRFIVKKHWLFVVIQWISLKHKKKNQDCNFFALTGKLIIDE